MIELREIAKNKTANIIVSAKSFFSIPLLVRKTELLPPKTPPRAAPLFCNKITTIRRIDMTI